MSRFGARELILTGGWEAGVHDLGQVGMVGGIEEDGEDMRGPWSRTNDGRVNWSGTGSLGEAILGRESLGSLLSGRGRGKRSTRMSLPSRTGVGVRAVVPR